MLIELARYIEAHSDEPLTLSALAARTGLSDMQLHRRFKALFGVSPKAYQDACRLNQLRLALKAGEQVTTAAYLAGLGSSSRLYAPARALGMKPSRYAQGGAHESISHALCTTKLGLLLIAATDQGVCFAQFGDDQPSLLAALHREFPHAQLQACAPSAALRDWLTALQRHLDMQAPSPQLPLDLRGSAFQVKVWRFLTGLEAGQTVSYGELASALGQPRATRAAASACARNRIAVLVPCHRVLRADGQIGGYRWDPARKRALLAAEAESAARSAQMRALEAQGVDP